MGGGRADVAGSEENVALEGVCGEGGAVGWDMRLGPEPHTRIR
jgi:hypothetical protein